MCKRPAVVETLSIQSFCFLLFQLEFLCFNRRIFCRPGTGNTEIFLRNIENEHTVVRIISRLTQSQFKTVFFLYQISVDISLQSFVNVITDGFFIIHVCEKYIDKPISEIARVKPAKRIEIISGKPFFGFGGITG
ncbi:hypothetical protein D3C80_1349740 [compost metagenome]